VAKRTLRARHAAAVRFKPVGAGHELFSRHIDNLLQMDGADLRGRGLLHQGLPRSPSLCRIYPSIPAHLLDPGTVLLPAGPALHAQKARPVADGDAACIPLRPPSVARPCWPPLPWCATVPATTEREHRFHEAEHTPFLESFGLHGRPVRLGSTSRGCER